MGKCPNCAAPLLSGDRFCTSCGHEIEERPTLVIPDVDTPTRAGGRAWVYWATGAVVVAGGAIVAFFLIPGEADGPTATSVPTLSVPGTPKGQRGGAAEVATPAVTVTRTPRPQVTHTVTVEPPQQRSVRTTSLDPCEGEEFPFSAQLEAVSTRPDSIGRREVATKNVQLVLRDLGYLRSNGEPLIVDGWYGEETKAAVQEFQRATGIDDSGTVYDQTWPLLGQVGAEMGAC